jgi:uncharacterized membrane protein
MPPADGRGSSRRLMARRSDGLAGGTLDAAREDRREDVDLARVAALSDGIFAVAMTLLIVGMPLPKGAADLAGASLPQHLLTLVPALRAVAISFFVSAIFWHVHHGFFRCLKRGDALLLWLNFLLLFAVALTPLSTYLLGSFADTPIANGLYAANVAAIASGLFLMWLRAALRRDLLRADVADARIRRGLWGAGLVALLFLLSIPVAGLSSAAARLVWLLIVPVVVLVPRSRIGSRP